jgi:DNA-directed RNA polymerase specialized sigma24 family protein
VQACIGGFADDLRDALHIPEGTVHPSLDRARHAPQDCLVKVPGGTR